MSDKNFKVKNKLVIAGLTNANGVLLAENHAIDSHTNLVTQYGGTGTTTSPTSGQILYSSSGTTYAPTTLNTLDVKGATYSADAPSSPVVGQIWVESDTTSDSFDPNIIRRQSFTATAAQTVFTTDIEFIQGYEQVFFNGMLLLRNSDYTTASNTNVTLAAGAAAGDILEVVTVTNLNSVNTYTQGEIDTSLSAKLSTSTAASTYLTQSNAATTYVPQTSYSVAGKNAVINGGMDIFQRNSFNTLNAYSLDRWYINASTTTTVTQSTAKTTPNSQYMMLMTATGTQQIFAQQAIETRNAIYYAGKTVTLSAYAAGLTTTTNWQMDLSYSTSTDNAITGSWTSITAASGNPNLTLSSTVTRWSATYNVPSDAKTLRVLFVNNAANITVGQGIYLGDVQLEIGNVATPFSRAGGTIQGELAACQRYYETGTGYQHGRNGAGVGDNHPWIGMNNTHFQVEKRATPTIALGAVTNTGCYSNSGSTLSLTRSGFHQSILYLTGGSVANMTISQIWTASAEL